MRTRTKQIDWSASWGSGTIDYETFYESSYPGPCNCKHYIYPIYSMSTDTGFINNRIVGITPILNLVDSLSNKLNWDKLPSSTKAGIIQILAEIDDTIAIFTTRFWRSLSYGSFTWGVIPFVSDLVAVVDAINNLAADLSKVSYEDTYEESVQDLVLSDDSTRTIVSSATFTFHNQGTVDYSFQHPGSVALDWLGLHPDLATAWDLIPFSFVIDYLIPIGDFLQSFRQGGWVKTVYFTGWRSCHVAFDARFDMKVSGSGSATNGEVYIRSRGGAVLVVEPDYVLPSFTLPSLREMFNMLYIFTRR